MKEIEVPEKKHTVTVQFDEAEVRRMEKVKKETGLSFSAQINLRMKGFDIVQRQVSIEQRRPPAKLPRGARDHRPSTGGRRQSESPA